MTYASAFRIDRALRPRPLQPVSQYELIILDMQKLLLTSSQVSVAASSGVGELCCSEWRQSKANHLSCCFHHCPVPGWLCPPTTDRQRSSRLPETESPTSSCSESVSAQALLEPQGESGFRRTTWISCTCRISRIHQSG